MFICLSISAIFRCSLGAGLLLLATPLYTVDFFQFPSSRVRVVLEVQNRKILNIKRNYFTLMPYQKHLENWYLCKAKVMLVIGYHCSFFDTRKPCREWCLLEYMRRQSYSLCVGQSQTCFQLLKPDRNYICMKPLNKNFYQASWQWRHTIDGAVSAVMDEYLLTN